MCYRFVVSLLVFRTSNSDYFDYCRYMNAFVVLNSYSRGPGWAHVTVADTLVMFRCSYVMGTEVKIPPFTRGKKQLSAFEIESTVYEKLNILGFMSKGQFVLFVMD